MAHNSCYEDEDWETGQLDDGTADGQETWDADNCWSASDDMQTGWEIILGTNPDEPYDTLINNKYSWSTAFFDTVPGALLDSSCDHSEDHCSPSWDTCDEPRPLGVEYVRHPKEGEVLPEGDITQYEFDRLIPENEEDSDGIHDLVLLVASGAGTFASVGAQIMDYIASSPGAVTLDDDRNWDNGHRQRVY